MGFYELTNKGKIIFVEGKGFALATEFSPNRELAKLFFEDGTETLLNVFKSPTIEFSSLFSEKRIEDITRETNARKEKDSGFFSPEVDPNSICRSIVKNSSYTSSYNLLYSFDENKAPTLRDKSYTRHVEFTLKDWYSTCTCGKGACPHARFVMNDINQHCTALLEKYFQSPYPKKYAFTKYIFSDLLDALAGAKRLSHREVTGCRKILDKLLEFNEASVTQRFILDLQNLGPYYDYDSHFLEAYDTLFTLILTNQTLYDHLVTSGFLADKGLEVYSDRQFKTNRVYLRKLAKSISKLQDKKGHQVVKAFDYNLETYAYVTRDVSAFLDCLTFYDENLEKYQLDALETLANELALRPLSESEEDSISRFVLYLEKLENTKDLIASYSQLLPEEKRIALWSQFTCTKLGFSAIKDLPLSSQAVLLHNVEVTAESLPYILKTFYDEGNGEEKGRYLLSILPQIDTKGLKVLDYYLDQVVSCPNARVLLAYAQKNLRYAFKTQKKAEKTELEKELSYFLAEYSFDKSKPEIKVTYSIRNEGFRTSLMEVTENAAGELTFHANVEMEEMPKAEEIKAFCLKGREDAFGKEWKLEEERVEAALFEKKNRDFTAKMQALMASFTSDKVVFNQNSKVGLEYFFSYDGEHSATVALKVGNSKSYVVKDIPQFLEDFRNGATNAYGKDLVLTHTEENLQERDKANLRLLLSSRIFIGRHDDPKNKRYLKLSDDLFSSLLENLQGREIYLNEEKVLVRLEKQIHRAIVNKNYHLKTTLEKDSELLVLNSSGYVWDKTAHFLDKVDLIGDELRILDFFSRYGSTNIKPILPAFKADLYSKFSSFIDIDEAVRPSFRLSQLKIQAYFDYKDGKVLFHEKLFKEEEEVKKKELQDHDRQKWQTFLGYLSSLGFDEEGVMEDEGQIISFFRMDFTRLRSYAEVFLSENLKNKTIVSMPRQMVRITYNSGLMELFLEKGDFSEKELAEILKGMRQKRKYVLLKGNRIVDIDNQEAQDFYDTVSDFQMTPEKLYEKKQVEMASALKAFAHQRNCHVDKYLRDMIEDLRSFRTADLKLPSVNATLRGYQREGYNWLSILSHYNMGGILADDMGLGKTLQMICLLKADKTAMPSLVVCPKSLVFNWKNEFSRFDGKTKVVEVFGSEGTRSKLIEDIDYKKKAIYITSYDSLRMDASKYTGTFSHLVLDEAQYIKNVHAQKTKSVKDLKALHRFALTGTPIENSVIDLWSIFDFLMPGYLEELSVFRAQDNEAIRRKVAPFLLRRTKEDVLSDLPQKYERILSAEMTTSQRKAYEALKQEANGKLAEGGKAFDILPYLTRLRQVCVDPAMFLEDYQGESGKMTLLDSLLDEKLAGGHRLLIFSQFVKALNAVERILEKKGLSYYLLTGDTPAKARIEMMNDYNEENGTDVFLVSLKAGGTGLNLTGADTVIHLDPWWNVAAEDQASDRAHRIGQKRNVEVIKIIAEDTIEQRVLELQEQKKDVIDSVISSNDASVTNVRLEDIAFLLG